MKQKKVHRKSPDITDHSESPCHVMLSRDSSSQHDMIDTDQFCANNLLRTGGVFHYDSADMDSGYMSVGFTHHHHHHHYDNNSLSVLSNNNNDSSV